MGICHSMEDYSIQDNENENNQGNQNLANQYKISDSDLDPKEKHTIDNSEQNQSKEEKVNNAQLETDNQLQKKKGEFYKDLGEMLDTGASLIQEIPVIGNLISGTLGVLVTIFKNLDGYYEMPVELLNGKNKLVQINNFLQEIKDMNESFQNITNIFYFQLNSNIIEYNEFINQEIKSQKDNNIFKKIIHFYNNEDSLKKCKELNSKLDLALSQFQISVIHDSINDNFPDLLKKQYKGKAGYKAWVYCFKSEEYIVIQHFVDNYGEYQQIEKKFVLQIANFIDYDQNGQISFFEFMNFVAQNIQYYDSKGEKILKYDELIEKLVQQIRMTMSNQNQDERVINYSNGAKYEGDTKDGKPHGKGKYSQDNVYSYEGQYNNGQKDGFGKEFQDGIEYEGEWKDNQKSGHGKIKYIVGGAYKGYFLKNKENGQGELIDDDGNIFTGNWVDGEMILGQIKYKDGTTYIGELKQTKQRNGKGITYNKDQSVQFEGIYKDNFPVFSSMQGIHHVVWYDGQIHENEEYRYFSAKNYESAVAFYSQLEVESQFAKVIVEKVIKNSYGDHFEIQCCIGYLVKNNILKVPLNKNISFVYGIPGLTQFEFDKEEEAQNYYRNFNSANKCLISQDQVQQYQGYNYTDAWLGQYTIFKMKLSQNLYHLVWFDQELHKDQNNYYGYTQSNNENDIRKLFEQKISSKVKGAIIFYNKILDSFGSQYYCYSCLGYMVRAQKINVDRSSNTYLILLNPYSIEGIELDEEQAKKKFEEIKPSQKSACILFKGNVIEQIGRNHQDAWIGQYFWNFQANK